MNDASTQTQDDLAYPWCDAPAPAATIEVAPGVHWLRMPLPFKLDHINLWVLEDGDSWTLVDTGFAIDEVRDLWRELWRGALGRLPAGRLICTHFHPDHFGLAGWLARELGIGLWMTRQDWLLGSMLYADEAGRMAAEQVEMFRANGLDEESLQPLARRGNAYRKVITAPPLTYERIRDGDRLAIGGAEWQVITLTGHTPEHACLYCPALNVLIAGDQVLPRISPNISQPPSEPRADPLGDYLDSLHRLVGLPRDVLVLPSHGLPFRGLHERLEALAAHHRERLDVLLEACTEPRSAAELLPVLFNRELDSHQVMFAMGESLSHLSWLSHRGKVVAVDGDGGPVRYRRSDLS